MESLLRKRVQKTPTSYSITTSFDVDGNITSYQWDFGDGLFGEGKKTVHSYSLAGPMRGEPDCY